MSTVQTELNAIKKVMTEKNPELLIRLDRSFFGNDELAKLFALISSFYVEHSSFMGWDVLRAEVAKRCKTVDKTNYLLGLLEQIQDRDVEGLTDDMLIAEMQSSGKCRKVLDTIEEITKAAEDRDDEAVVALFRKAFDDVFIGEEYGLEDCDMLSMCGEQPQFNFNKTGIEPLDDRGGLIEGGLTAIGGESGEGKSTMATQMAKHNYAIEDESVAYISYEQSKAELRARLLSAESGVDLGRIVCEDLTLEERLKVRTAEAKFLMQKHYTDISDFCEKHLQLPDSEYSKILRESYTPRDNKILLLDETADWDQLFVKMELLRTTKGVRFFILDYPYLVPRGTTDRHMANWEYNLVMSKKMKQFAKKEVNGKKSRVIVPAQFSAKDDSLKYFKGLVNDTDLFVAITADKDDKALNQVNVSFKKYRNFKTIPDKPILEDFKLQKEFHLSRFSYLKF